MLPQLVLASSSIPRKRIMDQLRLTYTTHPSEYEEDMTLQKGESFEDLVVRIALGKAQDVARYYKNAIIIAADSIGVIDNIILGKPYANENAVKQLKLFNNTTNIHYTGMALIDTTSGKIATAATFSKVHFRNLTDKEIKKYVDIEDVTKASGSHKIEDIGATLIDHTEGDFYAIIGLSPSRLAELFKKLKYNLFDFIKR